MACGAGLPVLALAVTAGHFLITRAYLHLARAVAARRSNPPTLR
jgi:putative Mg2+ transporter-C (MgtC) family protein